MRSILRPARLRGFLTRALCAFLANLLFWLPPAIVWAQEEPIAVGAELAEGVAVDLDPELTATPYEQEVAEQVQVDQRAVETPRVPTEAERTPISLPGDEGASAVTPQAISPAARQTFAPATLTMRPLLGREEETSRLKSMLDGARGRAIWVHLSGEPGCGKTRLLNELAHFAEEGGDLVVGAGPHPTRAPVPYGAARDILAVVIRSVVEDGRTVVFSSHLLDEIERVADDVAMIHEGRLAVFSSMDEIRTTHQRYVVAFHEKQPEFPKLACTLDVEGEGRDWAVVCHGEPVATRAAVEDTGARIVEESSPSLDAIFLARVTGKRKVEAVS